jgi:hypothetical protein
MSLRHWACDECRSVLPSHPAHRHTLGTDAYRPFRENLDADPEVAGRVSPALRDGAIDAKLHLKALDTIFNRVFGTPGPAAP